MGKKISVKVKVKVPLPKKKTFGSKGIFSGKRFIRQQSKGKTPPKVKGGGKKDFDGGVEGGNVFKRKKSYATPQKVTFKRKAKKADRVDTRATHTWGKHDTYMQGQGTLKQIKEKNMGTKKGDTPHTLKYKAKKKAPAGPIPGIATGGAPQFKKKRKSLLSSIKGAGKQGSGLRFKAFKKFRGG